MSFEERLAGAVQEAVHKAYGIELDGIHVERPNDPTHGDFATNVALANARVFRRNPREVAENLVGAMDVSFVQEAGSRDLASSTSGCRRRRYGTRYAPCSM